MRDFGVFLLAIAATIAVLATVDSDASSSRQPSGATSVAESGR